jgi:hypothetical protein
LAIKPLAKFEGDLTQKHQEGILFSLKDYLDLVDFTGRILHPNERGAISESPPPVLDTKTWL